jgi:FdhD protein
LIDRAPNAASRERTVRVGEANASWGIAIETPVELALNGEPWTVLLATPSDLEDLAIGLALTEGVLRDAAHVDAVHRSQFLHDVRVDVQVSAALLDDSARRARTMVSGTACGLCGLESLAQLEARRPAAHRAAAHVPDEAVQTAFRALPDWQPINAHTHSMHAAAWCALDGTIQLVREDVGRHNALDKLIGALARAGQLAAPGFIAMTSRCSYELVAKSAVAATQLLATISAPTSLALSWAETLGLPLASTMGRGDRMQIVRFPSLRETANAG